MDQRTGYDAIVIGAGLAGLTAARELASSGAAVVVLDKGRGVGGRLATRRHGGGVFDHGAQFITARSGRFREAVERWVAAGVAAEWCRGFADGLAGDGSLLTAAPSGGRYPATPARDGHPRYRGVPSMTAIPKHEARGLDVRCAQTVAAVSRSDAWEVTTDRAAHRSDRVILTAPVPQSLALLDRGGTRIPSGLAFLNEARYAPCITVLCFVTGSLDLPDPGAIRRPCDGVEWVACNRMKGLSPVGPALTIQLDPERSERWYGDEDEAVIASVGRLIRDRFGVTVERPDVKRWRYSRAIGSVPVTHADDPDLKGLVIAGDAFTGPEPGVARAETAFLSGLAAAGSLTG